MIAANKEWAAPTFASATIRMTLKPQATPARHFHSLMEDLLQLTYRLDAMLTFTELESAVRTLLTNYPKSDYMGCRT